VLLDPFQNMLKACFFCRSAQFRRITRDSFVVGPPPCRFQFFPRECTEVPESRPRDRDGSQAIAVRARGRVYRRQARRIGFSSEELSRYQNATTQGYDLGVGEVGGATGGESQFDYLLRVLGHAEQLQLLHARKTKLIGWLPNEMRPLLNEMRPLLPFVRKGT